MMELVRPKRKETNSAPESRPYRVRVAFKESRQKDGGRQKPTAKSELKKPRESGRTATITPVFGPRRRTESGAAP
jgi:hypothetical protein